MTDMQNKVAIVTGAASGIGKAAAEAFAAAGAKVVVADVQTQAGEQVASALRDRGNEAVFVRTDVSSEADVAAMVATAINQFGGLDYAFNNAGIEGEQAPTAECEESNWDSVITINLKGVWLCMKHEIPQMVDRGGGAIVNCASIAGLIGFPGVPAYVASKHGIVGLTKTAALEYAPAGIRVNAVCPGVIRTPMIERFTGGDAEAAAQLAAGEPIGRLGEPREIADAAVWLCSDAASFITGDAIPVDGGWVAQ